LEDELMRLFGTERIAGLMDRMGLKEGEVIQAGMMTRAIERAQKKVEENNFGIRKRLLDYDDVMNVQREVIYTRRRHARSGERVEIDLNNVMMDYAESLAEGFHGSQDFEELSFEMIRQIAVQPSLTEEEFVKASKSELIALIVKDMHDTYDRRAVAVATTALPVIKGVWEKQGGQYENIYVPVTDGLKGYNVPVNLQKAFEGGCAEIYKVFTKVVMLTTIDDAWREHLREMDELRQSVQNASYEQKDPLLIYKFESYELFSKMLDKVNRETLSVLDKGYIPTRDNSEERMQQQRAAQQRANERARMDMSRLQASRMEAARQAGAADRGRPAPVQVEKKVGRNEPCPCGSGKKYKQCHGK
jgi:preprotein translocase subunit SecA